MTASEEMALRSTEAPMTVGSLVSGIGGLDLGLERSGMQVRWQAEVDPYCSRVLAKHWPHVPNLGDVTKVDWDEVERVELICGGFPCQPVSLAGARRGQADERWLWPEVVRCLRVLRPRWALLENVPGLLALGFGDVATDLAALGYDFEWDCIPAAAVGAPHLRYRVFVVAHTDSEGEPSEPVDAVTRPGLVVPDAKRYGLEEPRDARVPRRSAVHLADSGQWTVEPDVGRVAHGVPARVDRLRALGNAVVPQVAEWIGRRILEAA